MTETRDGEEPDLYALGGEDRMFALALIHSDHTDAELADALEFGRYCGLYPTDSVLSRHALGGDPLRWRDAVAAALETRRNGYA